MATAKHVCACDCGTVIEFGVEYVGSDYVCESCGATLKLNPRIVVTAPKPVPAKPAPVQIPIPIPSRQAQVSGPSIETAWGWTWRVLLCLFIAGILISIASSIIAFSASN